jgi:hypothetical protein
MIIDSQSAKAIRRTLGWVGPAVGFEAGVALGTATELNGFLDQV